MKIFVSLVGVLLTLVPNVFADGADGIQSSNRFEVTFTSDMSANVLGKEQQVNTSLKCAYSILQKGAQIAVMVHSQEILASGKGVGVGDMVSKMSRTEVTLGTSENSPVHLTYDKAPPGLQKMMWDTFDTPLYSMTLDKAGNDLTYKDISGPGAASAMKNNGVVLLTRLFHPPFYNDKTNWVAGRLMYGGASGKINFIKSSVVSNGIVSVSFSGVLTTSKDESGGVTTITNAFWNVSGKEAYNTNIDQWETGQMTVLMSYESAYAGKVVGNTHGTSNADFRRITN